MENEKAPLLFPITVFEKIKETETLTRARARIFYKYENRNGSYITDDFAQKLIETIPGSPIKGIYERPDYTDHGKNRTQGRAYGFVPETTHNIAYEDHEDEDGVTRSYVCADVLLWTALYEEAKDIVGAPQSMELYEPSIKGSWKNINGMRRYVYTEGSFLGLQVLGKDVEPCFEGSAFFSLFSSIPEEFIHALYNSYLSFQAQKNTQDHNGGNNMPEMTFKLSDNQKANRISLALNKDNEYRYYVHETYDNEAIIFDYENEQFGKISFTKNDEDDTVTITSDIIPVFAEYVTEEEKNSLTIIRSTHGTYTVALQANEAVVKTLNETSEANVTLNAKVEELGGTISTLETEKENLSQNLSEVNTLVNALTVEKQALSEYKLSVEKTAKEAILNKFSESLDKATIETYSAKLDEFTVLDLEKELAFELVRSKGVAFTNFASQYIPNDNLPKEGIESVLDRYDNKKNK